MKWLIACSMLYILVALIAASVAIAENRPAEFGGLSTGLSVTQDFLYGNGTAMSPALYWLVAQAILIMLAPRRDRWGAVGVFGLAIFGLMFSIGVLGEPIIFETFNPATFNLKNALIQAGMFLLPLSMMIFGILEWSHRRKERFNSQQSVS